MKVPGSADALVAIARRTGDSTRDLSPATIELVRRTIPEALVPSLEGEEQERFGVSRGLVTRDEVVLTRLGGHLNTEAARLREGSPRAENDHSVPGGVPG